MEGNVNWSDPQARRKAYERRYVELERERQLFTPIWTDTSRYIAPKRGRFLHEKPNDKSAMSDYADILDNTATLALRTLGAGMMSGITSPARPWFKLGTPDPGLMEYAPVKEWLSKTESLMRMVFNKSNIYNALHSSYVELGLFGTTACYIDEDFQDVIRAYPLTAGQYHLGLSARNDTNTLYRKYYNTVWQVVERFGIENVSTKTRLAFRQGQYDSWVRVLHVVQPNYNYAEGRPGPRGFPTTSCYIEVEAGTSDPMFLSEGGYREKPFISPRWEVDGAGTYAAACPGMDSLGDVKQLQLQQLRKAEAIDKIVDPPMVAPPGMRNQPMSTLPGGVSYVDATGLSQGGFRPAYEVRPDINGLVADIQDTRQRIQEGFYTDLFRMLQLAAMQGRDITAREVAERHEEKLIMLGPMLERFHNEGLDPLIDRVFGIMSRAGMLPPAPDEIADSVLRVEYISILAQAQRAVGISGIERLVGFVTAAAQVQPEVVMKIDFDQAVEEYGDMLGVPPKIILSDDVVQKRREAAAALQAQQAQLMQAQQAASAAKDAASAAATEESVLGEYIG